MTQMPERRESHDFDDDRISMTEINPKRKESDDIKKTPGISYYKEEKDESLFNNNKRKKKEKILIHRKNIYFNKDGKMY